MQISRQTLKQRTEQIYDVLVIGGGAAPAFILIISALIASHPF
ncbi:MAG: hypothetical protein WCA35_07415 [Kovacikia sp.]